MIRVMVVDDEALALERLVKYIASDPEFKIVARAFDGIEAIRLSKSIPADVVFLDIDMPGKNGIEVALELADQETPPVVVFVTAHNEFAVKAFELHAIDYILKPYDPARLQKSLERVKEAVKLKKPMREKLTAFGNDYAAQSRKIVGRRSNSKERVLIDPADVFFFFAHLAQVTAHLGDKEFIVNLTLEELEKTLEPVCFARPHRAYIVNLSKVEKVVPMFNENFELILKDPAKTHIPLARRNAKEFKAKLSNW